MKGRFHSDCGVYMHLRVIVFLSIPVLTGALKFALCPKATSNPFFEVAYEGCSATAANLSNLSDFALECMLVGPTESDQTGVQQAQMIRDLIDEGIDGLAISVQNSTALRPVIQEAVDRNIPVVTFDSDDPLSARTSYVGTDNYFFGQQLGKVLKQLHPTGGSVLLVSDETPNIAQREAGIRNALFGEDSKWEWVEVPGSPINPHGNNTYAVTMTHEVVRALGTSLTAVVLAFGGPMFIEELWTEMVDEFPNVIWVAGDGLAIQLELLSKHKADGLVAQLPYDMGRKSVEALFSIHLQRSGSLIEEFFDSKQTLTEFIGTNVLEHVRVPLTLPVLNVDHHYLGSLSILGYSLYGIVIMTSIGFSWWTWKNRKIQVVAFAQPAFLAMVASGVVILGAAMIPLGFDDSSLSYTEWHGQFFCMAPVWLIFLGFTITFSALFAKMWRVQKLFKASQSFQRVEVKPVDVLAPFIVLFTLNFVTLMTWTLVDPLYYVRVSMDGTDAWNRVIANYGTCQMNQPWPFVSVLVALNLGVLLFTNYQAYETREIQVEFSEARYVRMVVACILQAFLIGIPLLFLVKELPSAWYMTLIFLIFVVCMTVLLLIFLPKIFLAYHHSMNDMQNKLHIRVTTKTSARQSNDQYNHCFREASNILGYGENPTTSPPQESSLESSQVVAEGTSSCRHPSGNEFDGWTENPRRASDNPVE